MSEDLELWLSPTEAIWSGVEDGTVRVAGLTLDHTIEAAFGVLPASKRRRWRRRRVEVRLAGALAQPFVVAPIAGLRSWRELEAAASAGAASATGLTPPLRIDIAPSPRNLGIAASEALFDRLLPAARASGTRIVSASAWWKHRWRRSPADAGTCIWSWRDPSALTVLVAQGDVIEAAFSEAPALDEASEAALIRRLRVEYGSDKGACIVDSWEDATRAGSTTPRGRPFAAAVSLSAERRLNLIRARTPSRAMWAVPVGLAVATVGLHVGAARWSGHESPPSVVTTPVNDSRPPNDSTHAATRERRESGWPRLLAAFEAAIVDGIVCESLDVDVAKGSAGLRLAFDEYATLDRYVRALNGELRARASSWRWTLVTAEVGGDGRRRATLEARQGEQDRGT